MLTLHACVSERRSGIWFDKERRFTFAADTARCESSVPAQQVNSHGGFSSKLGANSVSGDLAGDPGFVLS
jgi:hypothetical protein